MTDVVAINDTPARSAEVIPMHQEAMPMRLLELALSKGAPIEQLERLMALQERAEANGARRAYVAAMARFKQSPIEILKSKLVGYANRDGSITGYYHATLAGVTRALVPALAECGLSHSWSVNQDGGMVAVRCTLTHEAGHSESIEMRASPDASGKKNAIQQIASAVTYLQRYTLLAITGTSTEDMDDDGRGYDQERLAEQASTRQAEQPAAQASQADQAGAGFYDAASFATNFSIWEGLVKKGKRSIDEVIATVESIAPLTDGQKSAIRNIKAN